MGSRLGSSVKFYAGPLVLGAPDDLDAVICGFIAKAKTELLVAVQELDSLTITSARCSPPRRGRSVCGSSSRAITSSSQNALPDRWTIGGDYEANRGIHSALLRAGIAPQRHLLGGTRRTGD
jgi:hypothetical protein